MTYKNREDARAYAQRHYQNNKPLYKKRAKLSHRASRAKLKEWVRAYKASHPCKCGESDPVCLDFHHRIGVKEINISHAVRSQWSIKRLQAEMAKCEILCANCHRKEHARVG